MVREKSFTGVARFNEEGDLICFCYDADVEAGSCGCFGKHPCYQANFHIGIVRKVEPVEELLKKETQKLKQGIVSTSKKIKEGLSDLERAMKKNKFRL